MNKKNLQQPKVLSWMLSATLFFAGCYPSKPKTETHADLFSIPKQIEARWPGIAPELIAKAVGHTDQKIFVDPALLAAILETERPSDLKIMKETLYQKTSQLRKSIALPQNENNLFNILSHYYFEMHDPKNKQALTYFKRNQSWTPNMFIYQKEGLPYADLKLSTKEKELGIQAMASIPPNTAVYAFIKTTLEHYRNYYARPENFVGYDWIKENFNQVYLQNDPASFALQTALQMKAPATEPSGIYADLYKNLVLLGIIPKETKPSVFLLLKALLHSQFLNKDEALFKQVLITGDLSVVLPEINVRQLLELSENALERWHTTHAVYQSLKEMAGSNVGDREELMSLFIQQYNEQAFILNQPDLFTLLGLSKKQTRDPIFYEKLEQAVMKYLTLGGPSGIPFKGMVTSTFGWRHDPLTGEKKYHTGTDLAGQQGTPLKSMVNGTASIHYGNKDYGYYVIIKSELSKEQILYAHCQKILVAQGAQVKKGDVVALLGSTGRVTGPHLHVEYRKNGKLVSLDSKEIKDLMNANPLDHFILFNKTQLFSR